MCETPSTPSTLSRAFSNTCQAVDLPLPLGPTIIRPWCSWVIWYSCKTWKEEKGGRREWRQQLMTDCLHEFPPHHHSFPHLVPSTLPPFLLISLYLFSFTFSLSPSLSHPASLLHLRLLPPISLPLSFSLPSPPHLLHPLCSRWFSFSSHKMHLSAQLINLSSEGSHLCPRVLHPREHIWQEAVKQGNVLRYQLGNHCLTCTLNQDL